VGREIDHSRGHGALIDELENVPGRCRRIEDDVERHASVESERAPRLYTEASVLAPSGVHVWLHHHDAVLCKQFYRRVEIVLQGRFEQCA
jgi:hypothetical protein